MEHTFLWRIWERMLENEFVDRSVALGAKGFLSFFPFIIVVAAFVTPRVRASIFATLVTRFGLGGDSVTIARHALASSSDIRRATGVLGLILLAFYATSFTTALERVFVKAWRRPAGGTAGSDGVDLSGIGDRRPNDRVLGARHAVSLQDPRHRCRWTCCHGVWTRRQDTQRRLVTTRADVPMQGGNPAF